MLNKEISLDNLQDLKSKLMLSLDTIRSLSNHNDFADPFRFDKFLDALAGGKYCSENQQMSAWLNNAVFPKLVWLLKNFNVFSQFRFEINRSEDHNFDVTGRLVTENNWLLIQG